MTVFFLFFFRPFPLVRGGQSVSSFSKPFCLQHPSPFHQLPPYLLSLHLKIFSLVSLFSSFPVTPCYSIQLDESTDVSNAALLLVFVRYCDDGNIQDDLLFCKELPTRTTADEIIHCLDNHFTFKGIDWKNCVGVFTDGAASMTGIHCSVVKQIL